MENNTWGTTLRQFPFLKVQMYRSASVKAAFSLAPGYLPQFVSIWVSVYCLFGFFG